MKTPDLSAICVLKQVGRPLALGVMKDALVIGASGGIGSALVAELERRAYELAGEEFGLRAGLPGVGHRLRGGRVVARQGVEAQSDAGREDQPVVVERPAVGEADLPHETIELAAVTD